jgi:hypothetical protein
MGPMYKAVWVQDLVQKIQSLVRDNSKVFGIDESKPSRILDYACGHGTISSVSHHPS